MENKFEKVEASRNLEGSINNKFSYSIDQGDFLNLDYEKITEILNSDLFNDKKINFGLLNPTPVEINHEINHEINNGINNLRIIRICGFTVTNPDPIQIPEDCWGYELVGSNGNFIRISNSKLLNPPTATSLAVDLGLGGGGTFTGSQGKMRFPRIKGISELYISGSVTQSVTLSFYCGKEPSHSDLLAWI